MKRRIRDIAKWTGIESKEILSVLYRNDIKKNSYSEIDYNDYVLIYQKLFEKTIQSQSNVPEDQYVKIIKMIKEPKYHNTLKFLVHMVDNKEQRKRIIGEVAWRNPYLSSRILALICDNVDEEKEYLLNILKKVYSNSFNGLCKFNVISALLEIEETRTIEIIFKRDNNLDEFCHAIFILNNIYPFTGTEKQLSLFNLLIKFERLNIIGILLEDMERENSFDSEQSEKAKILSKELESKGHFDLAYRLLSIANLNQEASQVLQRSNIRNFKGSDKNFRYFCQVLLTNCNSVTEKQLILIKLLIKYMRYDNISDILKVMEEENNFNGSQVQEAIYISKKLEIKGRYDLTYRLLSIANLKKEALQVLYRSNRKIRGDKRSFDSFCQVLVNDCKYCIDELLSLLEWFIWYKGFFTSRIKIIKIIIYYMEKEKSFDGEQNERLVHIADELKRKGLLDLSNSLLHVFNLNQDTVENANK